MNLSANRVDDIKIDVSFGAVSHLRPNDVVSPRSFQYGIKYKITRDGKDFVFELTCSEAKALIRETQHVMYSLNLSSPFGVPDIDDDEKLPLEIQPLIP